VSQDRSNGADQPSATQHGEGAVAAGSTGERPGRQAGRAALRKKGSRLFGLAIMAALVGGVIWWKTSQRGDANAQVYAHALEIVENAPGYGEQPEIYEGLARNAHPAAFAETYSMGGRRTGASFDDERYLTLLFEDMISEAKRNGHDEAAADLEALRLVMRLPAGD